MDPLDFLKAYGPFVALGAFILYELVKGLAARSASQDDREARQNKRDSDIGASFGKLVDIFKDVAESTTATNERVAATYDRVVARMDENAKEIAKYNQLAVDQRAEQLILIKAESAALLNPLPRFASVIDAINGPIFKQVKDQAMDAKDDVLEEIRRLEEQVNKFYTDVKAGIEHLTSLVTTQSTPTPAPSQTVNVTYPGATVAPPTQAPNGEADPTGTSKKE